MEERRMAPCYLNLGTDRSGHLDGPSLYHRGKSLRPIGVLCDPGQGWTYNCIPVLGIEARFLRGLGNLPGTAPLVLFRIFVQMNIQMLLKVL
jgi:hypothetical protein